MLKISKLTDYAVVIMSHFASLQTGQLLSASEIAEQMSLAQPTVSKLLKLLSKAKLLESVCGADGGYRLVRASHQIAIADIIMAIEGLPSLTLCCQPMGRCMHDPVCMVKGNWQRLNDFILKTLLNLTLADMLRPLEQHPLLGQMMATQKKNEVEIDAT